MYIQKEREEVKMSVTFSYSSMNAGKSLLLLKAKQKSVGFNHFRVPPQLLCSSGQQGGGVCD